MFKKSASLGRFYWDCLKTYFRPSVRWSGALLWEFLSRLFYYYCNWWYNVFLNAAEWLAYTRSPRLLQVAGALADTYAFPNQFWVSLKEGLAIEPQKLYRLTYGETSWFTIDRVLQDVGAGNQDVFYDLGCGVGKNVFFAHIQYGIEAIGIDLIPTFIHHGQQIARQFKLSGIHFIQGDVFKQDLRRATIVFVTANCYDQECWEQLVQRLRDLKPGTRVISTARPIPADYLRQVGSQRAFFSWGLDRVYFHEVMAP